MAASVKRDSDGNGTQDFKTSRAEITKRSHTMAKYVFPAIYTKEDNGLSVDFPDIDGCFTCGKDLQEAIFMAEDALSLMLCHFEEQGREIPAATPIDEISCAENSFASYVRADTTEYRKKDDTKAVKKTLTIPGWLNTAAMEANINFSQLLQEALTDRLGLA